MRVAGQSITEVCKLTVKEARAFFGNIRLTQAQNQVADKILQEVRSRLQFLDEVGLDYLTLDRLTSTLSGGESQRIQLATSLGSHLVGALYVLDEPSDRIASTRYSEIDRYFEVAAGPGEYRAGGGARSGYDSRGGLCDRSGAGRRANSAASCCLPVHALRCWKSRSPLPGVI